MLNATFFPALTSTLQDAIPTPDAALPTSAVTPKHDGAVVPSSPGIEKSGISLPGSQSASETPTPTSKGSSDSLESPPAATPTEPSSDVPEPGNSTRQASWAGGLLVFYDDGYNGILFGHMFFKEL